MDPQGIPIWEMIKEFDVSVTMVAVLWVVVVLSVLFSLVGGLMVRYHLNRFSLDKLKAAEAELLYFSVSVMFVLIMVFVLLKL